MSNARKNRRDLELMADQIESIMQAARVAIRVTGGTISHRLIKFDCSAAPGTKVADCQGIAPEIARVLGRSDVRIYRDGAVIAIEVSQEKSRLLRMTMLLEQLGGNVPPRVAVLGQATLGPQDEDTEPLLLKLTGNVLITGESGAGKTNLLRSIVASLAYYNKDMRFVLIDPRRRGLGPLVQLPGVQLFERGFDAYSQAGRLQAPTLVVIDEISEVGEIPDDLLWRGPESGLYVVAATRKLDQTAIKRFNVLLAGVDAGDTWPGTKNLAGRGDFLLITKKETARFQSAWLGLGELAAITEEMNNV